MESNSQHSKFEPSPWLFWMRMAQIVLTVIIFILEAVAVSNVVVLAIGLAFALFTTAWSILYLPGVTWGIPRISPKARPNIIVLVLEAFTILWWLIAFALLALTATTATIFDSLSFIVNEETQNKEQTASTCTKIAAAAGAIQFILFLVTFIAICADIRQQRRARREAAYRNAIGNLVNAGAAGRSSLSTEMNGLPSKCTA